jgi:hypothetical protein
MPCRAVLRLCLYETVPRAYKATCGHSKISVTSEFPLFHSFTDIYKQSACVDNNVINSFLAAN